MAASRMFHGVTKSGSPTPREMISVRPVTRLKIPGCRKGYGAYLLRFLFCQFMIYSFVNGKNYGATARRSVCTGATNTQPFFL